MQNTALRSSVLLAWEGSNGRPCVSAPLAGRTKRTHSGCNSGWGAVMDNVQAALLLQGQFNKEALIVFTLIIAAWALARPTTIRDADNRRLPPNLTARLIIVLLYAFIYGGLVAAFVFAKPFVTNALNVLPDQIESAFKSLEKQGPLLAVMALVGLHSLAPFREAERAFIIWIHSVRHLHGEAKTLIAHFQTCVFTPSDVEHQKNLDELARHNIIITDSNSRGINLPSVNTWRKLTTMLRCLRDWNKDRRRVLSDQQMEILEDLERAHARKTRLATEILRLLNHVSIGKGTVDILNQLSTLLGATSHSDRSSVAGVEAQLKALVGGEVPSHDTSTVHLSSSELQEFLLQIDGYFQVEYQILLRQAAELTALSIVYAGDMAPERLGELKKLGFQGLGRIEPVSFDRILWLFLVISIGGFAIFYMLRYQQLKDVPGANRTGLIVGLGIFSVTMALATLIGAAFGSNKRHVHAQHTPWAAYFTAGLISMALFEVAHAVRVLMTAPESFGSAPGEVLTLFRQAPWAVIPFFLTIGICWLARLERWLTPGTILRTQMAQVIWERCLDGVALAILIFVAYSSAIGLHEVLSIDLPGSLKDAPYDPKIFLPIMLFGFLIGVVAVRDSRRAGRATIVDHYERSDKVAQETSPHAASWAPVRSPLAGQPAA